MNKQKSYHHPPTNPNFFSHTNYFFSVQLGHPKLSGYGLLSTQALQNRSQKYSSVSQSGATVFPWRDPVGGAPGRSVRPTKFPPQSDRTDRIPMYMQRTGPTGPAYPRDGPTGPKN